MKCLNFSLFSFLITVLAFPTLPSWGQTLGQTCAVGDQVCSQLERQRFNDNFNYRTPAQIYQRNVNQLERGCSQADSAVCRQIDSQINSAQENPTLQEIRQRQERNIPNKLR